MKEQMEKDLWCKIEQKMCRFIQHATNKEDWICCSCHYKTDKPLNAPPVVESPKKYYDYV